MTHPLVARLVSWLTQPRTPTPDEQAQALDAYTRAISCGDCATRWIEPGRQMLIDYCPAAACTDLPARTIILEFRGRQPSRVHTTPLPGRGVITPGHPSTGRPPGA